MSSNALTLSDKINVGVNLLQIRGLDAELDVLLYEGLRRQAADVLLQAGPEHTVAQEVDWMKASLVAGLAQACQGHRWPTFEFRPNWTVPILTATTPETIRLYALLLANYNIAHASFSGPEFYYRGDYGSVSLKAAIGYFEQLDDPKLNRWHAAALLAFGMRVTKERATKAVELLTPHGPSELLTYGERMMGRHRGRVPREDFWGRLGVTRKAFFSFDDLYRFQV